MKKNIISLFALIILFVGSSFTNHTPVIKQDLSTTQVLFDDEDEDGVEDRVDRCPRTPWGVTVDPDGCPVIIIDN